MNPLVAKYGAKVANIIAEEAKEYAIDNYSNPLARKFAEWSYLAHQKSVAKKEMKEDAK